MVQIINRKNHVKNIKVLFKQILYEINKRIIDNIRKSKLSPK